LPPSVAPCIEQLVYMLSVAAVPLAQIEPDPIAELDRLSLAEQGAKWRRLMFGRLTRSLCGDHVGENFLDRAACVLVCNLSALSETECMVL
jgi:hypothetical protein